MYYIPIGSFLVPFCDNRQDSKYTPQKELLRSLWVAAKKETLRDYKNRWSGVAGCSEILFLRSSGYGFHHSTSNSKTPSVTTILEVWDRMKYPKP